MYICVCMYMCIYHLCMCVYVCVIYHLCIVYAYVPIPYVSIHICVLEGQCVTVSVK